MYVFANKLINTAFYSLWYSNITKNGKTISLYFFVGGNKYPLDRYVVQSKLDRYVFFEKVRQICFKSFEYVYATCMRAKS